jgi:cytoskeleton protein RodZ
MSVSNGVHRITEFGDEMLQFSFTEECWVEVKSAAGDNLYSNLNRAGATLMLEGRGPFRILLGYAPGVTLTYNGEPVTLAPHTRNNVATLVLGQ